MLSNISVLCLLSLASCSVLAQTAGPAPTSREAFEFKAGGKPVKIGRLEAIYKVRPPRGAK